MRARIKAFEDIPKRWKCCDVSNNAMKHLFLTEGVLKITGSASTTTATCLACGNRKENVKRLQTIREYYCIPIECYDLDEGEA